MTLSDFDPRILNFLYELTKLKNPKSYREIADFIELESGKISAKTVERWFKFLKRPYLNSGSKTGDRMDYFPKLCYEKLGLVYVYVFSDADPKVLDKGPLVYYQNYLSWLYDVSKAKTVLLSGYLIPEELVDKFKSVWNNFKRAGFVREYEIFTIPQSAHMVYSPWHKSINSQGLFVKSYKEDVSDQIDGMIESLSSKLDNKISEEIKSNPLLIPVLFEGWREHKSSHAIWSSIKKTLGERTADYLKREKISGIKMVQKTLSQISRLGFANSMKLIYLPIQLNNTFVYIVSRFDNPKSLKKILTGLASNSIQSTIGLDSTNKRFVSVHLVSGKSLPDIFSALEGVDVEKILFLQHERSLPLLTTKKYTKFNYEKVFDPFLCRWKDLL